MGKTTTLYYAQTLASLAKHYNFLLMKNGQNFQKDKRYNFYGSDDDEIKFSYDDGYEKYSHKKTLKELLII